MLTTAEFQELREKIANHGDQKAFAQLYMVLQLYLKQFALAIIRNTNRLG